MTRVYITIDTEYSAGIVVRQGKDCRRENFDRAIACVTPAGAVGVDYQLAVLDRHGLKGVFFVDPMPALLWGVEAIADVVGPIAEKGHDIQLHLHTEWLELVGSSNPLGGRTGTNLKDFVLDDQCRLLDYARTTLVAAGAPRPVAFRAGNYGANDDTLRALAALGFAYDTSHCPAISGSACAIGLNANDRAPIEHCGVIEVPIGCIASARKGLRHAQVTALSSREILAAVGHAHASGAAGFTLVSHSFELLSRDRSRVNQIVRKRFDRLCAGLARMPGVSTGTYATEPPAAHQTGSTAPLPRSFVRSGMRLAEQAVANALYGGR